MAIKQLTLNQTIKQIRDIALSHDQINTVYFGDVWEFLAQSDNVYPAMFYSLTGSNISGKNLAMNFSLFFLDRQLQDESNETDVLSDQLLVAQDIFAMISYPKFDWEIDQNVNIEFFTENEKDYLAGVKFDIVLNYPMINDRCQVPSSFSYPDYIASISENGGAVNYIKFLIDYPSFATLPSSGDPGKIYVTNDTNKLYRWVDNAFIEISPTTSTNWGSIGGSLANQTDLNNALNLKAPLASPTFTGTVSGITKSMVGLGNVDNTSDVNKPISSATQTALDTKAPLASPTFTGTVSGITKSMVGLGNVDNTTDLLKPISTATQTALNLKYDASNPSGYISGVTSGQITTALGYTPENSANKGIANGYASLDGGGLVPSTQLPSYVDDVLEYTNLASFPVTGTTGKIYVDLATNKIYRWSGSTYIEVSPTIGTIWGGISGTLSNQTDLQNALNAKQATLSGTGFVKSTSGTISYDTNTYLTTSSATTTYVPYTGASGNVNLGTNNISANNFLNAFSNITASGTQVVLTVASAPEIVVNGSGGQTIKLPDATTLSNGATFSFNNNQSSGALLVNNNSNTLVVSVPSGGYCEVILIDNTTAAGNWDRHFEAPANVSWSTNTFDYAGSVTSATWNGNIVQPNRGGTGQSTYTDGQLLIGNTTGNTLTKGTLSAGTGITVTNGNGSISIATTITQYTDALARASLSFTAGSGAYNSTTGVITIPTNNSQLTNGANYITLTSLSATSPIVYTNTTGVISIPVATTSVSGYLSSTDWTTFNNKANALSGTINKIAKFTSTTAIGDSSITDTGSLVTIASPLTLSGAVTGVGNLSNYTVTASSGSAKSKSITSTLVASANSDVLVGLDIAPTFTNGSFTSTTNAVARFNGSSQGFIFADWIGASSNFSIYPKAIPTSNNYLFRSDNINTHLNAPSGILTLRIVNQIYGQFFPTTGNFTLQNGGTFTDAGYRLDVVGTTRFQGTTASDTAPLGSELAGVTGTGTNWALATSATNLNVGGYTHTVGSTTALTTALAAVSATYYQITYTITGRTAGSITIAYGGTSTGASASGASGPLASSTAVLTITPTTDFDGTVVLSIKSIGTSSASSTFSNSSGGASIEVRASSDTTNTFIGLNAGRRNTTAVSNTFLGVNAGQNTTAGGYNTSIGNSAGLANTIGSNNVFIGQNAGSSNSLGNFNVFLGAFSGQSNSIGSDNTYIGVSAAINNTTGNQNVFLGRNAGRYISDGSTSNAITDNSIYIGYNTKALASSQTNQIVIGYAVTGLGSNTTVLGNSSTTLALIYGAHLIGGTSIDASAQLQVDSTTKGILFPRMTTTQKNAISSPATGLTVFDTTLGKLCVFSTTWQTITSV